MFRYLCDRLKSSKQTTQKQHFASLPGSFADGLGFLHFKTLKNSEQVAA